MLLGEEDVGRSLLMIFSDGLDTTSWLRADAVVGVAKRSDVVAYAVAIGPASPFLRDLAAATGGRTLDLGSTKGISATFLQILEEFRGRYVISFSPRGVGRDDGWHRLQVRVKGRRATVKAREGYFAGR
jgi:VWFA-related protein